METMTERQIEAERTDEERLTNREIDAAIRAHGGAVQHPCFRCGRYHEPSGPCTNERVRY